MGVRSEDYRQGRLDGLREAEDIMRQLEADVAARLDEGSAPGARSARKTRDARRVRRQAFKAAATRLRTRIGALTPVKEGGVRVKADLARLGLIEESDHG